MTPSWSSNCERKPEPRETPAGTTYSPATHLPRGSMMHPASIVGVFRGAHPPKGSMMHPSSAIGGGVSVPGLHSPDTKLQRCWMNSPDGIDRAMGRAPEGAAWEITGTRTTTSTRTISRSERIPSPFGRPSRPTVAATVRACSRRNGAPLRVGQTTDERCGMTLREGMR